jgi:hypothetical protein
MAVSLWERCGAVNAIGGAVASSQAGVSSLLVFTLLSHSRLPLRLKSAGSRGQRPGVNLASGNERKNNSIHRAV